MSNPDKLYDRSRDELIPYEDSEFHSLIGNVPNFYISQTDQTLWGSLLRDVGAELGRLEYFHAYDIIGKNPAYLTPPDCKRQWNDPLFINKNYPHADQYDLDYKQLVVDLIQAYQLGATVASIEGVIRAYTHQNIHVEELWKLIGNGYYDGTVRNMLSVAVKVLGENNSATINLISGDAYASTVNLNRLKTITDDLYEAIDLAKPAHVGLNLTTIFGLDEHIGDYVYGRYGIDDTLRIIALMIEDQPLPDPLYQAPFFDPTHPDTGLASTTADNPLHKVFTQGGINPPPAQATYTLNDFLTYSGPVYTKGTVTTTGKAEPHPGTVSPTLSQVWEISGGEQLDIMDLD